MIATLAARAFTWAVRKTGTRTLLALGLLLAILESMAWMMGSSLRGLESAWLWLSAGLGLLAGWMLARGRLPGWLAGLLTLLLGFIVTLFRLAHLSGPLFIVLRAISRPALELALWPYAGPADFGPLAPALIELWSGISVPLVRLVQWSAALLAGSPAFDPAAVALLWNLVVLSAAAWAAWWVRRHSHPFLAVIPAGGLLAVIVSYQRAPAYPLLPLLGATLLLSALCTYQKHKQEWETQEVDYYEDVPFEIGLAAVALVLVAGAAFILAPSPSIQRLLEFNRGLPAGESGGSGDAAQSLGLKPRPANPSPFAGIQSPGLPRDHLLGSGPELSRQLVMEIQVEEANLPAANSPNDQQDDLPRLYWRGRSYDLYTGRGWSISGFYSQSYPAGERLFDPQGLVGGVVSQRVQFSPDDLEGDERMLYISGAPLAADQAVRAGWRSPQDFFAALLVSPASGRSALMPTYNAQSWVTLASQEQLRSAGQNYPDWVRERYLALPESVPARVLGLGRDLTAAEPTPYDRALAIEAYLRAFPYSLDVPAPPSGWDVSDYFLFDLKRGYCDYYATAMVVLARAAGLPARLVVGYASGEYNPESQTFRVTAADAHSWPEIYFPGIGWVEFEPTGGRPPIRRPEMAPIPEYRPAISPPAGPAEVLRKGLESLPAALGGLAGFVLLIVLARTGFDAWRLQRLSPQAAFEVLYRRLRRAGSWIGAEIRPADTPNEVAARIEAQVEQLNPAGEAPQPLQQAREGVRWLVEGYSLSAYSPRPPSFSDRSRGIRTWRALRLSLWLAQIRQSVRKIL